MTPETPPLAGRADVVARLRRGDSLTPSRDLRNLAATLLEEDGKRIDAWEDLGNKTAAATVTALQRAREAESENARLREQVGRLRLGLEKIEIWFEQFPPSGSTWPDGTPMSYGAAFGSNGERDFIRKLAGDTLDEAAALATAPDKQKDKGNG